MITIFLSSSNKIYISSKNINKLRKGEFDKVTSKTLQLNKTQVNDELTNEFIKFPKEFTNTVKFCNKAAADTIFKFNQFKLHFDNNLFNQNVTNIQLCDIFTRGLRQFQKVNGKTSSLVDEAFIQTRKTKIQYIIAMSIESKLADSNE